MLCCEQCFLILVFFFSKCCFITFSIITCNRNLRRNVMMRPSAWNLSHLQMNLLVTQLGDGGYVRANPQFKNNKIKIEHLRATIMNWKLDDITAILLTLKQLIVWELLSLIWSFVQLFPLHFTPWIYIFAIDGMFFFITRGWATPFVNEFCMCALIHKLQNPNLNFVYMNLRLSFVLLKKSSTHDLICNRLFVFI